MSGGLDYSKLSDAELKAIADEDYSKLSDKTLNAIASSEKPEVNEKELSGSRTIGAAIGADYGKDVSKGVAGAYGVKYAAEKGIELLKEKFPNLGATPSVTVEAAPTQYNTPHGVGAGAVKNAEHNVGEVLKNKSAQAALKTPGYVSPGNSTILMPENVAAQIAKEAPVAAQAAAPATKELSTLGKVKEAVGKVGNVLTPSGVTGKVLNTAAPIFSLAGAGALGGDMITRAMHGDYGRAAVSGLGAIGSAAAMIPHPVTRAIGTGAALLAPAINYGIDTLYGREGYADGGAVQGYADGNSVGPYVGYPQIRNKPRDPNFVQQSGPFLGGLDAMLGMGKRGDVSVMTPEGQAYNSAYEKFEPAGIAASVLPFIGGPTKALGKSAARTLGPKAADMAEGYLSRMGGLQYAVPNDTKIVRASEALAPHEGKFLNTTQSDRMRSTEGDLGGPGFSRFQNVDPAYKDAAWGVGKQPTATGIINLNQRFPEDKVIWSPMIGAETQHHSNQHVYDALTNEFNRQAKRGSLTPELRAEMNARLTQYPEYASLFQKGIDVGNPEQLAKLGNTFDRRGAISTVLSGKGVGGKKGQIFDYPGIMQEMTDPMTIGAPTHSVGTRLFTLNNQIEHRPDLHSAFPYILKGKDQGVAFKPIPKELAIPDWLNLVQEFKGRPAGYMDFTRGLKGKGTPNQFISDKYLRNLEKSELGNAAGGSIRGYQAGRIVKAAGDLILPAAENAARTQIIGTLPTYGKAAEMLAQRGASGQAIDFGAGLGKGADLLGPGTHTYEPFAKNWTPTFSNAADVPSDAYGRLTNLNVLNVVPREARDEIVQHVGRVMQPGGQGIITTRGADVMKAQGRPGPEPTSIITSRDTYQKGFTKQELEDYMRYMLGNKFDVNKVNLGPAGVHIQKKAEGGEVAPELTQQDIFSQLISSAQENGYFK